MHCALNFFLYLCHRNRELCWFDRDTHQITSKTELTSFANGGPQ